MSQLLCENLQQVPPLENLNPHKNPTPLRKFQELPPPQREFLIHEKFQTLKKPKSFHCNKISHPPPPEKLSLPMKKFS